MNAKEFLEVLSRCKFVRLRLFNVKLFGNLRWGLYHEFSIPEIVAFIDEFRAFATKSSEPTTTLPATPSFKTGSNFAILSRLCEQYYIYEGSEKLQKKIVSEVLDIIAELRNDNDAHAELEKLIDSLHANIMSRFRQAHPALKEKDVRLYCYLAAGFSTATIAVLLGKDKSVVYNRISRLKKQINEEFLP